MGPKRIYGKIFSLFIVKFKKLGFSAPLIHSSSSLFTVYVGEGIVWKRIMGGRGWLKTSEI